MHDLPLFYKENILVTLNINICHLFPLWKGTASENSSYAHCISIILLSTTNILTFFSIGAA